MIKSYNIEGLSCAACAVSSQKILSKVDGIESVRVNYATHTAVVESETELPIEKLNERLQKAGYLLLPKNNNSDKLHRENEQKKFKSLKNELISSAVFAVPLFIIAMFLHGIIPHQIANYIMLALTLPIMFWSGRRFFVIAWQQAKIGQSNMDTLVALGTGTAFLFSLFNTFFPVVLRSSGIEPHVYYETAGLLITFILLGRYFEERAKRQTSGAIEALLGLKVKTVSVIVGNIEKQVPIEAVFEGDFVIVRPGEKIPLDGEIISGKSEIDESMLSGESIPKFKSVNETVFAGTINCTGSFTIKVTKSADNTVLSQLIKLVEAAQSSQAPVQKLVDKVSSIFVPAVIAIALLSGLIWWFFGPEPQLTHAIITTVTILVIACPCALGLATPTAIMVGVGRAASKGILIKGAESLQSAKTIDAIIFDKTGTLTEGKPKVNELEWISESETVLNALSALEKQSEHPLSKAIFAHLNPQVELPEVSDFKVVSGRGLNAKVNDIQYFAGNLKWMQENNINISPNSVQTADEWQMQGQTIICFSDDKNLRCIIALSDIAKASAKKAVSLLKNLGIEVYMLTGDNNAAAAKIAVDTGIEHYKSEVLPQDKIEFVKQLQSQGKKVAMVGDGINDAPALAQANLGIAMNSGTDIAMESADMVLLKNDPFQVLEAISLSRKTMRILNQNLFWAFFYNVLGIPIAAGALYPLGVVLDPMLAGAAMAFSSVSVVLNSLRLARA
jgi:Cu2+-exporting ATPase